MGEQVTEATVLVNNDSVAVIPESIKFNEGLGEQKLRPTSLGGGKTGQVYSRNVDTNIGRVKFEIPVTVPNLKLAKGWKSNSNRNVVQLAGSTVDGTFTRTFNAAALTNDYEVGLSSEGNISLEFEGAAAI